MIIQVVILLIIIIIWLQYPESKQNNNREKSLYKKIFNIIKIPIIVICFIIIIYNSINADILKYNLNALKVYMTIPKF